MKDAPAHFARPLRLLFWESTAACNLSCKHCRRLEEETEGELTTDEFRGVIDSAAELGKPIIVFSGGEPLQRADWYGLADHARSRGLPTALATNGTLVDAALAERITSAGFHRVSVSIDGADAATHDEFRGAAGAFEAALAGIAELRRAGQAVQINASIALHNFRQVDELYDLACRVGAEALHLFLLVPVGCGQQIAESHQLSPAQCEKLLNWLCDRQLAGGPPSVAKAMEGRGLSLKATCAPHYMRVAAERGLDVRRGRGCLAGVGVIFVSHVGEVFPCGYLPLSCGSVRRAPLAEIWRDSKQLAEIRDYSLLTGNCGSCRYKGICGGCRARAYAETGDWRGAEPMCVYGGD